MSMGMSEDTAKMMVQSVPADEDHLDEVEDIIVDVEAVLESLRYAEAVETQAALISQLELAVLSFGLAKKNLDDLMKRVKSQM